MQGGHQYKVKMEPVYNSSYGLGMEGFMNYANVTTNNLLVPVFLFVIYGLMIYVLSKSKWKTGVSIMFASFISLILGMVAKTFTSFSEIPIIVFVLGFGIGIVVSYIENTLNA